MGDFNVELSNNFVDSFCGSYCLKNRLATNKDISV